MEEQQNFNSMAQSELGGPAFGVTPRRPEKKRVLVKILIALAVLVLVAFFIRQKSEKSPIISTESPLASLSIQEESSSTVTPTGQAGISQSSTPTSQAIISQPPAKSGIEKISVSGEVSPGGIYDPSVEYDNNGVGWLAYTAMHELSDKPFFLETHLAKSMDHGKTWTKVGVANSAVYKTLVIDGKSVDGFYRKETATLLFDSSDLNSNRRWKLFVASGFAKIPEPGKMGEATYWDQVYIAYKYAASPDKLSAMEEIPLLGSKYCKLPTCSVKYNLNNFHQDLNDVTFYQEPGSLVKDGVLYLSLSAVSAKGQNTILLSSGDHGENWRYLGTLTTPSDAKDLGYYQLTASSMAEENGRVFLLVSPVQNRWLPPHLEYNGVYIFEFENIADAKLKRDSSGKLIVQKYIPPLSTKSVGGGQSEYHEQNTYGGIVMAQSDASAAQERFKVYNTGENITR